MPQILLALDLHSFETAFVTLLFVVEPLGLAPIFLAATRGFDASARWRIALRACLFALLILTGTALAGGRLLTALGISLPAFRVAGGLLLFAIAAEMTLGVRIEREARAARQAVEEHIHEVAVFPLAIPLMAGPGAIAATLLLAERAQGDTPALAALAAAIAAVIAICLAVYALAGPIGRVLGASGNLVLAKVLGLLLAALAVQYVADGALALLRE
jgi:multiple antibiotic resistance protein